MPLAKLADLKARIGVESADTSVDALLTQLLDGVSALIAQHLARTVLYAAADITEVLDGGSWDLALRAWPVTAITSIKEASDRNFTAASALVENADYVALKERGILTRLPAGAVWLPGRRVVQAIYRGGYADPVTAPPEGVSTVPRHIQEACLLQATDLWRRKDEPGDKAAAGLAQGMSSGNLPPVKILPMVKELLRGEVRW